MTPSLLRLTALGALAGTLLLSACSDSSSTDSEPTSTSASIATPANTATSQTATIAPAQASPTTAQRTATSATPAASPASSSPTTSGLTAKVSANNATRAELQAAFTAAGINGAAQWAREVEEYRPYPTNDPNMAKLRQELAKYNPGPGVVDQIIAALSLP